MMEHHKIPDDGKQKPRDKEGGSKGAESQWPGHVDHWYEEIFQVSAKIPINANHNQQFNKSMFYTDIEAEAKSIPFVHCA